MKKVQLISIALFLALALACASAACTLWSAAGTSVSDGGTMISKNRDWSPQYQTVRPVKPKTGHRYVALIAENAESKENYVVAGTNEHGFTVVVATASSIPTDKRKAMPSKPRLLSTLLTSCRTVQEALSHKQWFYGPRYLLLSDRKETALIEIGPDKKIHIERTSSGVQYHTNFYVSKELAGANVKIGTSSKTRYARIGELLRSAQYPLSLAQFRAFSIDEVAGPDNSLFRTGIKERTLATWIVRTPRIGSPTIYVTLWNPGVPEKSYELVLDDVLSGKIGIK